MATDYPGALDLLTNPGPSDNLATVSHSAQHTNANDAIEAIQTTLGTNPQGAEASVKARLDAADTASAERVVGPASSVANAVASFNGTSGKIVKDSGATIDVSGNLTLTGTVTGTGLGGALLTSTFPSMSGVAAAGTSTVPARADHVHPSDTTKVTIPSGISADSLLRFPDTSGAVESSVVLVDADGDVSGVADLTTTGATVLGDTLQVETTIRVGGASGPLILTGVGDPEDEVAAPVSSLYLRVDGGTDTALYVKESGTGTSGWVAK